MFSTHSLYFSDFEHDSRVPQTGREGSAEVCESHPGASSLPCCPGAPKLPSSCQRPSLAR